MGPVVDEGSYQEVMNQLSVYTNKVFEHCANMRSASNACISSMGDDPAAAKSAEALNKRLGDIQGALEQINQVRAGMANELEASRRAAARANFY